MTARREVHLPDLGRTAVEHRGDTVRAGLVPLHGAQDGRRDQPLFDHLVSVAVPEGYAVLAYDRRPAIGSGDVPLADQADDALAAARWLAHEHDVPVVLFGFSQGAWSAALAASRSPGAVAGLLLVGCSGVSPARQMRFFVDEALRRAGHPDEVRTRAAALRASYEQVLRGSGDRGAVQRAVDAAAAEPWFPLLHLPREVPGAGAWQDLDHDPVASFAAVRCPVLLVYGEDEDTVPVAESVAAWRAAGQQPEVALLPGWGHFPAAAGSAAIDERYSGVVARWLRRTIGT